MEKSGSVECSGMPPEPGKDLFGAPGTGQLICYTSVAKKHNERYTLHAEA
jgi:hypothetical protein